MLTLWHALPEEQVEVLQALADEWAARQAVEVRVELEGSPDEDALHHKLVAAIQTNMTPSLSFVRPSDLAEYADADALLPLDGFIARDAEQGEMTEDKYFTRLLDNLRYRRSGNLLYALPVHRYQTLLFVNQSHYETLGRARPPATWEELLQACAAYREQGGERCVAAFPDGDIAVLWLWNHGGEVINAAGTDPAFQHAGGRGVLEWLAALRAVGGIYLAPTYEAKLDAFASGDTLFTFDSTARLAEYEARIDSAFDMTLLPPPTSEGEPVTLVTGGDVAIFRSDGESEALAWDFLHEWTGKETNLKWAEALGAYPVRYDALHVLEEQWPERSPLRVAAEWLSFCRSTPLVSKWPQIEQALAQSMINTITGAEAPAQALEAATRRVQGLLDEQ